MSLKKQIKEMRLDVTKRDEELEVLRKSIKITKLQEQDTEIKTYKDECTRLRHMLEDLMQAGPQHPVYTTQAQSTISKLEDQVQQQNFLLSKL